MHKTYMNKNVLDKLYNIKELEIMIVKTEQVSEHIVECEAAS